MTEGLGTRQPTGDPCVDSLDLRGSDARALRRVRQWLATMLGDREDDHVAEVTQVADELVSNAFEHGGGPQVIRLYRDSGPGRTTVEVEDSNLDMPTMGRSRFGEAAHRGRGLVLVDELANAWGVRGENGSGCKTVWAVVTCEATRHADG